MWTLFYKPYLSWSRVRFRRVERKSSPFSKLCVSNWQSLHNVWYLKMLQIQNHSFHFTPLLLLHLLTLAASSLKEIDMNFLRGEECLRLVLVHFSFVESHVVRGGPPLDPHKRTGRQFCALGPEAEECSSTITAPRKNWQLATGQLVRSWTFGQAGVEKASREGRKDMRPVRELEGDWTRRRCRCVLSLHCSPNYPAAVPHF